MVKYWQRRLQSLILFVHVRSGQARPYYNPSDLLTSPPFPLQPFGKSVTIVTADQLCRRKGFFAGKYNFL